MKEEDENGEEKTKDVTKTFKNRPNKAIDGVSLLVY